MKPADVLRKAAHVVMERGFARGNYEVDGRVCALGACRYAAIGQLWANEGDPRLELYYGATMPEWRGSNFADFNDYEAESAHDVASLLMSEAEVIDE